MYIHTLVYRVIRFLKQPDGQQQVGKRILHGISWAAISSLVTRLFSFGVALVQSHILGKQGYGELGIVLNTLILFGMLSSGYGSTCAKFIPELRAKNPTRAGRIFALSTVLVLAISIIASVALVLSADIIAKQSLNAPHLAPLLRLSAIALVLQSISGISDGVLSGLQAFKTRNITTLFQVIVWLPATILLTSKWNLMGAVTAYVFSYFIGTIYYIFALYKECRRQQFRPIFKQIWSEYPVILHFTLPMLLNYFLVIPTNWISSVMLAQQADGYAGLGSYNAASQWRILVLQIPFLIQATVSPVMNEVLGKGDIQGFSNLFLISYRSIFCAVLNSVVGGIVLSKPLMSLFGKDFGSEYFLMYLVMVTSAIMSLSIFIGNAIQIIHKTWITLIVNIVLLGSVIICTFVLIPNYGAIGLGWSFLISYFLQCLVSIYLLNLFLKHIKIREILILLGCIISVGIAQCFIMKLSELLGILSGSIVIIGTCLFAVQKIYPDFRQLTKSQ